MGERYDARRELGPWHPVAVRARDDVRLVPERAQPMRVTEELSAGRRSPRAAPGVHIVDLGQNMVGWVRLRVSGARGTRVQLRFAEILEPDGSLHLANLRGARQLDTYVLAGDGVEEWEPRFTFHGFRYVEVTGIDEFELTGRVVHSDTPACGEFECSDELVNQLWRNIRWGQRGNFLSVPTDCPQRDERLGWLADAQVFLPTATLNMDVAAFITKWGDDLLDAQSPEGAYPDVAPRLAVERDGAAAWADAGVIVPWLMWQRYGDVRFVERHWDAMERYMAYLLRHNPDLLWTARRGNDYGDWLSVGAQTPARRARHRLLGLRRAVDGGDGARPRAATPRTTSGCARGSSPHGSAPTSATTPTSRATPRPCTCWRCTWTCCPRSCGRAPPSGWSRTSRATTGTSRRGSSASGCSVPC